MSTSDQQGRQPLTRKQLRELRLTGATPTISNGETPDQPPAAPVPAAPLPRAAEPVEIAPAPVEDVPAPGAAPLTRRQARAQERIRTASVPVVAASDLVPEPVDAAAEAPGATAFEEEVDAESGGLGAVLGANDPEPVHEPAPAREAESAGQPVEAPAPVEPEAASRPVVSSAFGKQLLDEKPDVPAFAPSFDELLSADSGGSHSSSNTLIFTPHPAGGSLSGPIASTGEVLVTGSYELPHGLGSQGHAHGAADGKEADAVLIDGELPPASSPTPIAASSAVSTIKPAGEVIRPPAPEKGNKLMIVLAITAGGLALALAVALIIAFTTNVF